MKVIDGDFGKKKSTPEDVPTSEFLTAFVAKAMAHEEAGSKMKCAVVMYEDGAFFEVASNEQYPDGVYMLLQMAAQAIINETLGVTE
jgi:hypothetical protein